MPPNSSARQSGHHVGLANERRNTSEPAPASQSDTSQQQGRCTQALVLAFGDEDLSDSRDIRDRGNATFSHRHNMDPIGVGEGDENSAPSSSGGDS